MNSGCICCTLVGDFSKALQKVLEEYSPDRVIIEPSGVGKLSDIVKAIEDVKEHANIQICGKIAVVDGKRAKLYMKNFGEFFEDQVAHASTIVLSRTQMMADEKVEECVHLLREKNADAAIVTTPWEELGQEVLQNALLQGIDMKEFIHEVTQHTGHHHVHHHEHEEECECGHHHDHAHHHEYEEECECGHHHVHHHEHEEECECGHHHDHAHHHGHEEECECGHHHDHAHHHEHEEECECGHHHEHHDHDHECGCGGHHHHDHHHADEVFTSWGRETAHKYTAQELDTIVKTLAETESCGKVLRAKGIIAMTDGSWAQFDLVPGEFEVRQGTADYTGRICVIGTELMEEKLEKLFLI